MEVSRPDHRFVPGVGVWLSPMGAYATACPYPGCTDEDGWALCERISEIARGVVAAHGWYWIDRAVAQAIFPRFHFEGLDTQFGEEGDQANPM